jgi:hypothetical protein
VCGFVRDGEEYGDGRLAALVTSKYQALEREEALDEMYYIVLRHSHNERKVKPGETAKCDEQF